MRCKKIIVACLCMTALAACSCGTSIGKAEITRKQSEQTVKSADTSAAEDSEAQAEAESETVTTTVPETTTTTTTTTKGDPVALKDEILSSHSFSTADFPSKVYSNSKLKKAFEKIDDICARYGTTISFAYKNMDTGAVCKYNETASYGVCSTVKAPFCKNLLASGIDLDEKITTSVIWSGDSGTVATAGYGKVYTAKQLIKLAITQSDNTAYYNLVNYYGYTGFNEMNYSLGVNYNLGYSWIFNYANVNDMLIQYEDIYNYSISSKRGNWLTDLMTTTDVETQITAQLADKYQVSHKYGSDWDQVCYHDCAICYADSPFVLVIMTHQTPETEESDKVFKQLAKQFDIVNEQLAV